MKKIGLSALCTLVLCVAAWAMPCDPALTPTCGNRAEGAPCDSGEGRTGVWVMVASFPASIDLCTGFCGGCGPGPCNALEEWHYTWEVWECVQGDAVAKRQGCIREVLSRNGTGRCCSGAPTPGPVKPVVPFPTRNRQLSSAGKGCGCAKLKLPAAECRRCHDSWQKGSGLMMGKKTGQACVGCHDHHKDGKG